MTRGTLYIDQLGGETYYTYDANGQIAAIENALGESISIEYDALGNVSATTDARGKRTEYSYTANGLLSTLTDADGGITSYTYDAVGNLTSMTDPLGNETTYDYDAANQVVSVTNALGYTDSFTYDANGRITSVTDKNGNTTSYEYDKNGNVVKTTDAEGGISTFAYDELNRLVSATLTSNSQNQATLYKYDRRGLVKKVINAANNEKLYVYDGNGNLISETDEDGYVKTYAYDARNLVESIAYTGGKNVNFTYNAKGELTQMTDWTGTTNFTLDLLGRITSVNDSNNKAVSYGYDTAGNKTSIVYPDNSVVQYGYDDLNRLISVTDPENAVTSYAYDAASRLTSLNYPNGRSESYTYDLLGQLLETVETVNGQESVLYQYAYDPMGNLISEVKRDSSTDPLPEIAVNTYNNLNQLTTKTVKDEMGTTISTFAYLYDNRGNLISETDSSNNTKSYSYDATNKMVLGTNADGDTSAYSYNGLGYLVNNTMTVSGSVTTSTDYVIDYTSPYQSVLAKYEAGGLTYKNVYGLDRISTTVTDSLSPANTLKAYIQNDRLGSGRYASNTSGEIIGFTDMDEWGNVIEKTVPTIGVKQADILNNFTNHEFDELLGVYYAKARFYDPTDRRFLAVDPVKGDYMNPQTFAQYTYVLNNPLLYTDPDGEDILTLLAFSSPLVLYGAVIVGMLSLTYLLYVNSNAISYPSIDISIPAESFYTRLDTCGKVLAKALTPQDIGDIAKDYPIGECVEASKAIAKALRKNKQKYEMITIQYPSAPGFVISLTHGGREAISINGFHVGVLYNEMVYCNIHPYGLPIAMWLNDFKGTGYCTVTPSKYQGLKIQGW